MAKVFKSALAVLFLTGIALKAESVGYGGWIERREALRKDPSVARYYTFEDVRDSKSVVADLGRDGKSLTFTPYKDPRTGEVFDDLQVIEGRWPEKKAVRLDRGFYRGEAVSIKNRQFTVEAWFRRQGPGSITAASNLKDGTILAVSGYTKGWRIVTTYDQPGTLRFCIGQPGGCARTDIRTPLPDNIWHHLAATWDGAHMKVYINGKLSPQKTLVTVDRKRVETDRFEGDYVPTDIPFKIGYSEHGVGSVKLDIDEVVIYNRALGAEEVERLGRGPSGISTGEVFSKADAFIKAGGFKEARAEYGKLTGLPSYGKELALFSIAGSYRLEKDYAGAHKTYGEIFEIPNLTAYYRIYGLFLQAEVYLEQKDYASARRLYGQVEKTEGALRHHVFTARLKTADSYRAERKYSRARDIYVTLLREEESSALPHEGYRLDLKDRLEAIDGLGDGQEIKSRQEKLLEWVDRPGYEIYVSPRGSDAGQGTRDKPFATIKRAQEEVRKVKAQGMPRGGIKVCMGGGKYFLRESLSFGKEDSGTENAPVVYANCTGEEVRIIGGRQVDNFKLLEDQRVLERLPETSRGKVWVADLKEAGINDYGKLSNRGGDGPGSPGYIELFFNGRPMRLSRWPNEGHARVGPVPSTEGKAGGRGRYMLGKFHYTGDRPERWLEEKEIWLHGFLYMVFSKDHVAVDSIDTESKTIYLRPDTRWAEGSVGRNIKRVGENYPYYVYNLLSELDNPGEWYLDRDTGRLYFYPPEKIEGSEIIVSTLDAPVLLLEDASHLVFSGLTFEVTRRDAVDIKGGRNNLVAKSVIRNTGQWGVIIEGGWEHKVVGCDIYDTGEGGVSLDFDGNRSRLIPGRKKLIPARHLVENNHIYRFNRFDGGYRQGVRIHGIGQRVSHNVIHDAPMQGIYFNANDHVIEFNELHDVVHEGRELGAIYIYGEPWYLMSRGTVIRNNFFHHISYHSSPNLSQGLNAIHIDAINGGLVIEKNIFYRTPNGISNSQPENRLENNIFIEMESKAISQGNRWTLFNTPDGEPLAYRISAWARRLKAVNYKQPPWSYRYPQLVDTMFREKPVGWAQNNFIERNINTGGPFIRIAGGIRDDNFIRNNWDGEDPLFVDRESMDFNIRPGSSIYGLTGCEPLNMDSTGVYEDPLRASWPIKRTKDDIGKYYKADWKPVTELSKTTMAPMKRVSRPLEYTIPLRKSAVKIDGRLEKGEWGGLDMKKAMVIGQYYTGEKIEGAKSYAWLMYDKDNLYVAMKHEADPYKEDMPARAKKHVPVLEVAIESQHGAHSHGWWIDDMVTGPIYSISGRYDGSFAVNNLFGMAHASVRKLEASVEYDVEIEDDEKKVWTSEMKIPLAGIGINPGEVEQLAFNIGVYKKAGWFAWVATGQSIWRIENAGFIRFAR